MWKRKKKTKATLISQPDMWLAMILPGPGEAGLPRTSSLGERTIRQCREWSRYTAFQMPVASKGPPQLIHCHSCKGGGVDNASNSAWSKGQDRITKMSLPKPPAGRRMRAQRGRCRSVRGLLCVCCPWPQADQPRLEHPQTPSAHHPPRCSIPFMHNYIWSRILSF